MISVVPAWGNPLGSFSTPLNLIRRSAACGAVASVLICGAAYRVEAGEIVVKTITARQMTFISIFLLRQGMQPGYRSATLR